MTEFEFEEWEEDKFENKKRELEQKGFKETGEIFTILGENAIYEKGNEIVRMLLKVKEPKKGDKV